MDEIYQGCMTKNVYGTNKVTGPGEKCLAPTSECFWKDPSDIKNCMVKTRSCTKNEPTASVKACNNYFKQKQWTNHWVLGTTSEYN